MTTVQPDQLLAALRWRYATKQFDPARKIPAPVWHALEQALILSPSSFGLQPWRFLNVVTPGLRARLREHSWGQSQTTDASHFVVFAAKEDISNADIDRWLAHLASARGISRDSLGPLQLMMEGFTDSLDAAARQSWAARQCYIALGQFMTSAAILGIDTCPIEGIEPAAYDHILGLPAAGYRTVVTCAAGFRSADDKYASLPKVRYAAAQILQQV